MSDKTQVHVYLKPNTVADLIRAKEKTGRPYGEIVDDALQMYFDIPARNKALQMLRPTNEKLAFLEQKTDLLLRITQRQYRIISYLGHLITNGIPIVSINGEYAVKPYGTIITSARKKAQTDYSKLRSEDHLPEEDFLSDKVADDTSDIQPVKTETRKEFSIYPFR